MEELETSSVERPSSLPAIVERIKTGCGNAYITITYYEGKPFEVFAQLGKSGTCPKCGLEAVARVMSRARRYGIPLAVFVKDLRGILCNAPVRGNEGEIVVSSCYDAIGSVLEQEPSNRAVYLEKLAMLDALHNSKPAVETEAETLARLTKDRSCPECDAHCGDGGAPGSD